MATIGEQLAAATVDNSLKVASLPAVFTLLPWSNSTGTFAEATGWSPPGFTNETDGKGTGANGGLYYNSEVVKGGNAYTMATFSSVTGGLLKERQFSAWLFADVTDTSPDGYQLIAYQNEASATSGKTFMFKLKKWVAGVGSTIAETEATMEPGGSFALVKASGKVSVWVKKSAASEWAIVGTEHEDLTFTEGRSGLDGNGSNPKLTNFATGTITVGPAPVVTTKTAKEVDKYTTMVSGEVNPKSAATNYWFEYGKTTEYGFKTAVASAGSGSAAVAVERGLKDLIPGTVYHFRLVAESPNGRTNGADATFTTKGSKVKRRKKPDLTLDIEVETPDGKFRLPADSRKAKNLPRDLSFETQQGDGFGVGNVNLSREIFKEYPDIGLLDTWRAISHSGDIAYEGRLQSNPRTNDPEEVITAALIGWMSYLSGKKISPLIIDPRMNNWGDISLQRKQNVLNSGNFKYDVNTSQGWRGAGEAPPGINFDFSGITSTLGWMDLGESMFYAGGEDIGKLLYHFHNLIGAGNATYWQTRAYLCNNDIPTASDNGIEHDGFTNSNAYETLSATTAGRKYALIQSGRYEAGASGAELKDLQTWEYPKVVGNHGLTIYGTWPEVGCQLTDIVSYILRTYYPKVSLAGVFNSFIVQAAAWHDSPEFGYDIIKILNNLALWELNMWENRTLYHEPADLTKYDWQFKTTDEGVTVNFQGDSIENFANGCTVFYTDFNGTSHALYPSEHSELRDESEDNPANRHGEDLWTDCTVPYQVSEAEALQFGRVYLAEFNRPKRPGQYKIEGGYIEDAARQLHPGWEARNGQTVGIMDMIDDEPRLITATSWDDVTKTLTITVDAPDKLLDAIVARQEIARQTRGL